MGLLSHGVERGLPYNSLDEPDLKSFITFSLSTGSVLPCIEETVKSLELRRLHYVSFEQ